MPEQKIKGIVAGNVSSVMLFCKIGIAKQKTIRQPDMIHVIQFPYWMGSEQRLRHTEMILAQVWNEQICPFKASKPVIFVLDGANNLHLGSRNMGTRILREARKYGISRWFITQWADDDKMLNNLSQAALRIFFRPGAYRKRRLLAANSTALGSRCRFQIELGVWRCTPSNCDAYCSVWSTNSCMGFEMGDGGVMK